MPCQISPLISSYLATLCVSCIGLLLARHMYYVLIENRYRKPLIGGLLS